MSESKEASSKTLEGKMNELLRYLEEKNCFGLKVECSVCDTCYLKDSCVNFTVERLVHEEHQMEKESARSDMESELVIMEMVESEAPAVEVKPVAADPVVDWNVLVVALLTAKPANLDSAVELALSKMPEGTDHDFAAKSICSIIQKFAGKGLLELSGESIAWR